MRGFGFSFTCFLVITFTASLIFSVSAGTTKEHKKKLLERLRAALNASDTDAAVAAVVGVDELDKAPQKNLTVESEVVTSVKEIVTAEPVSVVQQAGVVEATEIAVNPSNNYILQIRAIMKRIMAMLGFRKEKSKDKENRGNRMLDVELNEASNGPSYRNEVRTTVGAVMGQKECIQKVACGAGSYLKHVKGKQIIFSLLESFSPPTWKDTVKVVKRSALFDEKCNFRCLEDDD